jgi:hypothetical protein
MKVRILMQGTAGDGPHPSLVEVEDENKRGLRGAWHREGDLDVCEVEVPETAAAALPFGWGRVEMYEREVAGFVLQAFRTHAAWGWSCQRRLSDFGYGGVAETFEVARHAAEQAFAEEFHRGQGGEA